MTVTDAPALQSLYAAVSPTIPAPITATSVRCDFVRPGYDVFGAIAVQQQPDLPGMCATIVKSWLRINSGNDGARAQNRLDVTLTDALVSQPETGKISRVHLLHCGRLPPDACPIQRRCSNSLQLEVTNPLGAAAVYLPPEAILKCRQRKAQPHYKLQRGHL
jgi:hypothetical protein